MQPSCLQSDWVARVVYLRNHHYGIHIVVVYAVSLLNEVGGVIHVPVDQPIDLTQKQPVDEGMNFTTRQN